MSNSDNLERLGLQIDKLCNLRTALQMPLPAQMHVDCLREQLPEVINEIHEAYVALGGEPIDLD